MDYLPQNPIKSTWLGQGINYKLVNIIFGLWELGPLNDPRRRNSEPSAYAHITVITNAASESSATLTVSHCPDRIFDIGYSAIWIVILSVTNVLLALNRWLARPAQHFSAVFIAFPRSAENSLSWSLRHRCSEWINLSRGSSSKAFIITRWSLPVYANLSCFDSIYHCCFSKEITPRYPRFQIYTVCRSKVSSENFGHEPHAEGAEIKFHPYKLH